MSDSGAQILIVDDDPASRDLLEATMARGGFDAVAVSTGEEALEAAERSRPELVLLDIMLPGINGYEVQRQLRQRFGDDLAVIFISGARAESVDRVAGLMLGADDYVSKPFDPDELLARARRFVRSGEKSRASARVGEGVSSRLTSREAEVLGLLAEGLDQRDIAARLYIAPKTVATHIQRILAKLGVHSRAQAVALVHRTGL
jgi:DNA-binding NarL/FixJ family response regulator